MPADTRKLYQVIEAIQGAKEEFLDAAAIGITNDIVMSFNTSPPGRTYKRKTRIHIASQPGYPPNVDTDRLRSTIRWYRAGAGKRRITDGVNYGIVLETVLNRPFFAPVFEEWRSTRLFELARRQKWTG